MDDYLDSILNLGRPAFFTRANMYPLNYFTDKEPSFCKAKKEKEVVVGPYTIILSKVK